MCYQRVLSRAVILTCVLQAMIACQKRAVESVPLVHSENIIAEPPLDGIHFKNYRNVTRKVAGTIEQLHLMTKLHETARIHSDTDFASLLLRASHGQATRFLDEGVGSGLPLKQSPMLLGLLGDFKRQHLIIGKLTTIDIAFDEFIKLAQSKLGPFLTAEALSGEWLELENGIASLDVVGASMWMQGVKALHWMQTKQYPIRVFNAVTAIINKALMILGYYQDSSKHPIGGFAFTNQDSRHISVDPEVYLDDPNQLPAFRFVHSLRVESIFKFKIHDHSAHLRDALYVALGAIAFYQLSHPVNAVNWPLFSKDGNDTGFYPANVHRLSVGLLGSVIVNLADLFIDQEKRRIYKTHGRPEEADVETIAQFVDVLARLQETLKRLPLSPLFFDKSIVNEQAALVDKIQLLTWFVTSRATGKFLADDGKSLSSGQLAGLLAAMLKLHVVVDSPFLYKKFSHLLTVAFDRRWRPEISLWASSADRQQLFYSVGDAADMASLVGWTDYFAQIGERQKFIYATGLYNLLFGTGMISYEKRDAAFNVTILP